MKKNIAIIGASYLQLPLIEKAKEMGFTTHVFAWAANDVGEKEADFFYPISIVEKERIASMCKDIGICAICSIASDLAAITVNYVAQELGLVGNDMQCTMKSTNKHLMRLAFEQNGDPSPKSVLVDETIDVDSLVLNYPAIVKPTDRSGSRGICKVDSPAALKDAILNAVSEGMEKKALVEEYVEGTEYSVEGISFNGNHHILAVTLKFTTGAPQFIETGHIEPAPIDSKTYKKIVQTIKHALDSLGIKNSASHSEIKISQSGSISIIEIGARMGGGCIGSDLVPITTGIDYLRATIDVACGKAPCFRRIRKPRPAQIKFILSQSDHDEFLKLLHDNPQKIGRVAFYHPEWIGNVKDESNRAGCYIVYI